MRHSIFLMAAPLREAARYRACASRRACIRSHSSWTALFLLLGFAVFGFSLPQEQQDVPGSAARGAALFEEKGCVRCHLFSGRGGSSAPDLAQRSERAYTPALLASLMWNHAPAMWEAMRSAGVQPPSLSSSEAADLFAHFYSLFYFSIPGDAARGKSIFEQKNCVTCHSPGKPGPPLSTWLRVKDPIAWAERMWNHSGGMAAEMDRLGIDWPQLSTQNMVDLLLYIRNNPAARSQSAVFAPGDPLRGRATFERNCASCHSFGERASTKVDLMDRPGPRNLTDYVTAMWNHAPRMRRLAGSAFPDLASGEMNDLVAYMFAQRYFYERGDTARGERVYQRKNCVGCHDRGGPDLTRAEAPYSAVTIVSALWRHGPAMLDRMRRQQIAWPQFAGSEMTNLIAYLNSRRASGPAR